MRIRSRWLTNIGAFVFAQVCRAIFMTARIVRHHEGPDRTRPEDSQAQRHIFSIWHDSVVGPLFGGRTDRLAVLTSRHHDGAFVTAVLRCVGLSTIRGSTSRGGATALREMMRSVSATHLAITPDGPRGPRRQMSRGLIYLASRSGSAIVPIGVAFSNCWKIHGGWTYLAIPKPFSTVALVTGDGVRIPSDLEVDLIGRYVERIQNEMDRLTLEAERLCQDGACRSAMSSVRAA